MLVHQRVVLINYNKWLIGWFHRPLDIWKVLSSATLQGQLDFPGGYDRWSMPPSESSRSFPITKWGCPKIVPPKFHGLSINSPFSDPKICFVSAKPNAEWAFIATKTDKDENGCTTIALFNTYMGLHGYLYRQYYIYIYIRCSFMFVQTGMPNSFFWVWKMMT